MKLRSWIVAVGVLGASVMVRAQNNVVGELFASDASVRGSVLLAGTGTKVVSGSSVTAGDAPAVFRLARGGDLRICPATSVTLTSSSSGREVMIGISTGSIEAHYTLALSADTIMTPDFRILLAGPGTFNFAIKADDRGNVAVRALAGNTASLIVSELNGDGTYQVKPSEEVIFHNGKLGDPDHTAPPDASCPAPPPVQRAAIEISKEVPKAAEDTNATAPAPVPMKPVAEQHLEAAVPFIYQAGDPAQEVVVGVARLRLTHSPVLPGRVVLPPPPPPKEAVIAAAVPAPKREPAPKRGFFGKVGAFFAAIFH
jgi:hypothetical protein